MVDTLKDIHWEELSRQTGLRVSTVKELLAAGWQLEFTINDVPIWRKMR